MNKRNWITALIVIAALVAGWRFGQGRSTKDSTTQANAATPTPTARASTLIAAPGRVEPISEEIKINAEISGRLRAVLVEEGQAIQSGQTIA